MRSWLKAALVATALSWVVVTVARAEMLAMVVYETKAEESIRALRVEQAGGPREDGLAIVDVDPDSPTFGNILARFPLPTGLAPHHQYYNRDATKLYVTSERLPMLHVVDMTAAPYRLRRIDTPDCAGLDAMVFSEDGDRWWLTCMATHNLIVGDARTDKFLGAISVPLAGPHTIALYEDIDRILVTNTFVSAEPLRLGESVTVIEASSGTVLSSHKLSRHPSPSGTNPIGLARLRDSNPPLVYVVSQFGGADKVGAIWAARWSVTEATFGFEEIFNFQEIGGGYAVVPTFGCDKDRLLVTSIQPGAVHLFDIGADDSDLKLVKTLPTAQGAHHMAYSPDCRYVFVQNGVLNLPGLNDGSITVIDLETLEVVNTITTFKDAGYTINHILMLPEWNRVPGG